MASNDSKPVKWYKRDWMEFSSVSKNETNFVPISFFNLISFGRMPAVTLLKPLIFLNAISGN